MVWRANMSSSWKSLTYTYRLFVQYCILYYVLEIRRLPMTPMSNETTYIMLIQPGRILHLKQVLPLLNQSAPAHNITGTTQFSLLLICV